MTNVFIHFLGLCHEPLGYEITVKFEKKGIYYLYYTRQTYDN